MNCGLTGGARIVRFHRKVERSALTINLKLKRSKEKVNRLIPAISRAQLEISNLLKEWFDERFAALKESVAVDPTLEGRISDQKAIVRALETQQSAPAPLPIRHFIHYWILAIAAAMTPCFWLVRFHRRQLRIAAGRCLICGYDLRATHGRCPECGTVASVLRNAAEKQPG